MNATQKTVRAVWKELDEEEVLALSAVENSEWGRNLVFTKSNSLNGYRRTGKLEFRSARRHCQCCMTGRNCLQGIFSVHLRFGSTEIFCQRKTPGVSEIPMRRTTVCNSQSLIHICRI